MKLTIVDDDAGTIRALCGDEEVRSWSYGEQYGKDYGSCADKMRSAREFAEGWFQAFKRAPVDPELL